MEKFKKIKFIDDSKQEVSIGAFKGAEFKYYLLCSDHSVSVFGLISARGDIKSANTIVIGRIFENVYPYQRHFTQLLRKTTNSNVRHLGSDYSQVDIGMAVDCSEFSWLSKATVRSLKSYKVPVCKSATTELLTEEFTDICDIEDTSYQ